MMLKYAGKVIDRSFNAQSFIDTHAHRITDHYLSAREKHPYFCDIITCLSESGADTHLSIYRATLAAEIEAEAVETGTLLDCEFYEAIQAYTHGNITNAVEGLYDCIAVCLRAIDVLEGRQKLGKPQTISGNDAEK